MRAGLQKKKKKASFEASKQGESLRSAWLPISPMVTLTDIFNKHAPLGQPFKAVQHL